MPTFATRTRGLRFKVTRDLTKDGIMAACNALNDHPYFEGNVTFKPEGISEGGIQCCFSDACWYKTVRLCVGHNCSTGKWPWVDHQSALTDWQGNDQLIVEKGNTLDTFLKSYRGAPAFSLEELHAWEECLSVAGLKRVGRFPGKRRLTN
jgi:hypothetical protein